jgi:hypothetical protein
LLTELLSLLQRSMNRMESSYSIIDGHKNHQTDNNLMQDPAFKKLLALSWLTLDQTLISEFPLDCASKRWGLVAPRQTAKPPV